jgi:ATP-dependent DNA helicase RecQ
MSQSMMTPKDVLLAYWGHTAFRTSQEEIINSLLEGKDTLAILPTGGGKSVCFQVPAMMLEGCCLVISPLIALMEDQVQRLQEMDIPAMAIMSGMSYQDTENALDACMNDALKFLYVSPERLETRAFRERLRSLPIALIAVDEAHCISQWGYDFRPSYLHIARIREYLPRIPVIALTASATEKVKEDIAAKLIMKNPKVFMTSFARKNLSYSAEKCDDKINRILQLLKSIEGTGIIYCRTRRRTKEISDLLQQHGISCDFYHAGLNQENRKEKQEKWIKGHTRIIACTNAFGMGIDKPDVRLVIHADMTDCLENYYQEAGRAGRDGKTAHAFLLYRETELQDMLLLPSTRFPDLKTIRKVYHSLANYHQVPTGMGQGKYFDFEMEDFMEKFKLNMNEVVYSLQALKQEHIISYLERVYMPSTVQFISDKASIQDFENGYPAYEPMIKALLRNYAGVFDIAVKISEMKLSWILKRDLITIHEQLALLHRAGIIAYNPKKETPQICYLQDRIKADELNIDHESYFKRKKEFTQRIENMIEYAKSETCRSAFIGRYFGDLEITACGNCDACINKTNSASLENNFSTDIEKIIHLLKQKACTQEEIILLSGVEKTAARKLLHALMAEERISIDLMGKVCLR